MSSSLSLQHQTLDSNQFLLWNHSQDRMKQTDGPVNTQTARLRSAAACMCARGNGANVSWEKHQLAAPLFMNLGSGSLSNTQTRVKTLQCANTRKQTETQRSLLNCGRRCRSNRPCRCRLITHPHNPVWFNVLGSAERDTLLAAFARLPTTTETAFGLLSALLCKLVLDCCPRRMLWNCTSN